MSDMIADYEGTVAPSFLKTQARNKALDMLSKLPMRLGRIVKVHSPSDPTSRSRAFYEYDVLVDEGSEHSVSTRTVLPHCWMISDVGGAADFSKSTLRALEKDKQDTGDYGLGNQVLVMLVNASTFAGVIIGGMQHSGGEKDDPAKGHYQVRQFNGLRQEIDNDGQLHITFGGASDISGNPLPSNDLTAAGTILELLKTGFHVDTPKDAIVTCGGNANITSNTANITLTANVGTIQTNSLFVKLGTATDAMVKGTTYRAAESVSNASISAALGAAALAMTALSVNPVTAPDLPSGPITATFVAAAGALTAAAAAIAAMEAGSAGYLSFKNSLD